ncbi:hypothetical protein GCM10022290_21300 [Sagittula marina]
MLFEVSFFDVLRGAAIFYPLVGYKGVNATARGSFRNGRQDATAPCAKVVYCPTVSDRPSG